MGLYWIQKRSSSANLRLRLSVFQQSQIHKIRLVLSSSALPWFHTGRVRISVVWLISLHCLQRTNGRPSGQYFYEAINGREISEISWGFGIGSSKVTLSGHVEVATQASYFGQRTIFGVILHLFLTITFFHFFRITVQVGIPAPSFSSVVLLGD